MHVLTRHHGHVWSATYITELPLRAGVTPTSQKHQIFLCLWSACEPHPKQRFSNTALWMQCGVLNTWRNNLWFLHGTATIDFWPHMWFCSSGGGVYTGVCRSCASQTWVTVAVVLLRRQADCCLLMIRVVIISAIVLCKFICNWHGSVM